MAVATIVLDCALLNPPTARTIDEIGRLQLAARRHGVGLRFENANSALLELIDFCGLGQVLGVEAERKAKQRKQPGRVEEEGDVGDSAV